MVEKREPRFGDWMRGIYAGPDNPIRDGMYVETIRRRGRMNPGKWYRLTDGKGKFWEFGADSVEFLYESDRADRLARAEELLKRARPFDGPGADAEDVALAAEIDSFMSDD